MRVLLFVAIWVSCAIFELFIELGSSFDPFAHEEVSTDEGTNSNPIRSIHNRDYVRGRHGVAI